MLLGQFPKQNLFLIRWPTQKKIFKKNILEEIQHFNQNFGKTASFFFLNISHQPIHFPQFIMNTFF